LPRVELNTAVNSVFEFRAGDVTLLDYDPHPAIRAPIAV
jgi:thymidylate synthase